MSQPDTDGGPGLGPFGALGLVLGLIAVTLLVKVAYVAALNDVDPLTTPSGENPMVTYRTDAEREHDDKVAATQASAAWFAVDIRTAIEKRGLSQRTVLRAIRNGTLTMRQSDVVATRLMWVKPTRDGLTLCVESEVTAAVVLDTGNIFKFDSCNAGVPVTTGASR